MAVFAIVWLLACSGGIAPPPMPPLTPERSEAPDPVASDAQPTPAQLYAGCRDRVEEPEGDGECQSDADCSKAGCSQEVCTTGTAAAEVVTTCDIRPCMAVLEHCGCVSGRCTWSLKAAYTPPRKLPRPEDAPQ